MGIDSITTIRIHKVNSVRRTDRQDLFRSNKVATAEAATAAARNWYERHLSTVDERGLLHFHSVAPVN